VANEIFTSRQANGGSDSTLFQPLQQSFLAFDLSRLEES
jgi:hypothetical protein